MKKLSVFVLSLLFVFAVAACEREEYEETVMFDEDEGRFQIEEGAELTIGVDSDELGAAIVEQWNEDFPEYEGMLSYTFYNSVNQEDGGMEGLELLEDEAPDVALVIDNELIGRENAVRGLHDYFIEVGEEQTHEVYEEVNILGNFLLPAFYDTMVFSWNKTMLEDWGVDVDDRTENNLPAELATWEDIFDYAENYGAEPGDRPEFEGNDILEFFPISVAEVWSAFPQLSAGGWRIYSEETYTEPEFDTGEFLAGLEFLEEFSNTNMSVDETGSIRGGADMVWRWDGYLDGDYPFGMVGTWMDVNDAIDEYGYEFEFSTIPTWQGEDLSALYKTKGFVINSYTEYPSAANEVMRWLYTQDTMEMMINNSTYLPALQEDAEIYPENIEDEFKEDMGAGMEHHYLEPAATLPENPTVRAMSVYYNIGVEDYLIELWDGERDAAATQSEIVDAAEYWIENNNTRD